MPKPKPSKNEERDKFIERCMRVESKRFKDRKQALAVCFDQWRSVKTG